jgi:hypothetical protein
MQWTTRDPMEFGAGQSNLYEYAGNNPTNNTDPSGEFLTAGLTTLIGAAVGAVAGFVAAGATGENGWDWSRAWAGAGSGALVGAGIGAAIETLGAATPLSVGLIGAAIGSGYGSALGGDLLTSRKSTNWSGYEKGGWIGGIAGFTGGYAGALVAPVAGGGILGGSLTGSSSAVIGDVSGQGFSLSLGWQKQYNPYQTLLMGGFGGLLGGAAGYLSRVPSGAKGGTVAPETEAPPVSEPAQAPDVEASVESPAALEATAERPIPPGEGEIPPSEPLSPEAEQAVAAPPTRSGRPPLTFEPTVDVTNKYGEASFEADLFDSRYGAGISGVFDSRTGTLFIRNIKVASQYRGRTLGDQLYKTIIDRVEAASGTPVRRVTGNPALDNEIGPGGASETPRARSLQKLDFTNHSYDEQNDLMISER